MTKTKRTDEQFGTALGNHVHAKRMTVDAAVAAIWCFAAVTYPSYQREELAITHAMLSLHSRIDQLKQYVNI